MTVFNRVPSQRFFSREEYLIFSYTVYTFIQSRSNHKFASNQSLMSFSNSHPIIRIIKEQGFKYSSMRLFSYKYWIVPFKIRISSINSSNRRFQYIRILRERPRILIRSIISTKKNNNININIQLLLLLLCFTYEIYRKDTRLLIGTIWHKVQRWLLQRIHIHHQRCKGYRKFRNWRYHLKKFVISPN